ncbi:MAG: thiamine pyrophosphate-binding protein [Pseudomonadota bacterium]
MTQMTTVQALVRSLISEHVQYVFGIFGHGNVQLGQALYDHREQIKFIPVRNEQAGVHAAAAIARLTGFPQAVTTSVGPGATNLVTGAAMARVNRWPVLLLPGEVFSENIGPVLQQIESNTDITANDSLRPVSKFWTRLNRPSRIRRTIREAFDAMLEPGDEGPATICLPMDVQAETCEIDTTLFFSPRDKTYPRIAADSENIAKAIALLDQAQRPLIIAGGGVLRSHANAQMISLAEHICAPVAPTQAGKGTILFQHPLNVFGVGPTGSAIGNCLAATSDLILGIGTRYSDFVTASETAFSKNAHFVNLNICHFDVSKQRALKLWGDAQATLSALLKALKTKNIPSRGSGEGAFYSSDTHYFAEIQKLRQSWIKETEIWRSRDGSPLRQSRAISIINELVEPDNSVVISAAGTLPGDLHKLWRDTDPHGQGYLCEYGYSTMGFEIAAGLGAKLALPEKQIIVLVGDLSFLMMHTELVTAAQQGVPFTVIVFDNNGGQSIRHLQKRSEFGDFGMELLQPNGKNLFLDFAGMARAMACYGLTATDETSLRNAFAEANSIADRPTVIDLKVDKEDFIGGYDSWWDVPQPEIDETGKRRPAREEYIKQKTKQVIR